MQNFLKWVLHSAVQAAVLGIPFLLQIHPVWIDLTVGGMLTALYNYLISTQTVLGFSKY